MASYIDIPKLNTLTFRPYTATGEQTFHNRNEYDEDYVNYNYVPAYQHFDIGDNILIQITTNNTLKKVFLMDLAAGTETELTAAVANYSTAWSTVTSWPTIAYDTLYVYDKTIYTSLLSGYYQVRLEFDAEANYKLSEPFRVHNCDSEMIKYTWSHSKTGLRKGIYFDGTQEFSMRIDSRFLKFEPGINVVTNESFNSRLESLESDALFYATLELGGLPRFLIEKINVTLQVDTKEINGVQYECESGLEVEHVTGGNTASNLYIGSLKFRMVDYEDHEDFESAEVPETYYELVDDFNDDGEEEAECINDDGDIELIA